MVPKMALGDPTRLPFETIHSLYANTEGNSMDAIGAAHPQNEERFLKIIHLDQDRENLVNTKRGFYDEERFDREVIDATFAAGQMRIGPQVYAHYVTRNDDGSINYGVIEFERLHASLESLFDTRKKRVDQKFALHSPTLKHDWGDMSEDDSFIHSPRFSTESAASPGVRESTGATHFNTILTDFHLQFQKMLSKMDEYSFFHLDMHPGNFFYKEKNGKKTWYLIDYGLVKRCETFPCQIDQLGNLRFATKGDLLAYSVRVFRRETTEFYDEDVAVIMWGILEEFLRSEITQVRAPVSNETDGSPPRQSNAQNTGTPPTR